MLSCLQWVNKMQLDQHISHNLGRVFRGSLYSEKEDEG